MFACLVMVLLGLAQSCSESKKPTTVPASETESAQTAATPTGEPSSTYTNLFRDPFAYCDAVGAVDRPDDRWAGAAAPMEVLRAARADLTAEIVSTNGLYWRCLDAKLLWCVAWGTNWCAQTDTSRTPLDQLVQYCAHNENTDVLNPSITGKGTAWAWRCHDGTPEIVDQIGAEGRRAADRGFDPVIWREVPRGILKTPVSLNGG
jgi:hypothetical protein